jgi:hypothetical protein
VTVRAYPGSTHNAAFFAAVKAAWPLTGDAQAPDGVGYDDMGRLEQPYAVVYPQGTGQVDGSLDATDLDSDAWPSTQVTYVGRTRDQADSLRTLVRGRVLGTFLTVSGRQVGPVRLELERPIQADHKAPPVLFYAIDLYRAFNTPS